MQVADRKTTAIKSTETAKKGARFAKAKYQEALEGGKTVAWSMARVGGAHAILKALDVVCLFPENYATVCAAKQVSVPYLDLCAREGLSRYLCGYFRTNIGLICKTVKEGKVADAPWGGIARPDFFIANLRWKLCDEGYKFFHTLGRYIDVPGYILDLPIPPSSQNYMEARDRYLRYIVEQYKELTAFIERITGRKMNMDVFLEAVDNNLETYRLWYECLELRKAVPSPMPGQDAWSCLPPGYFWPSDRESVEFYRELRDELKDRVDKKTGAIANERYRMVFTEGAPYHTLSLFDELAAITGAVVVVEGAYYAPGPPPEIPEGADPFYKLALRYWADFETWLKKTSGSTDTWETDRYLDWAREYQCDGGIMHHTMDCRTISTLLPHIRNVLLEHAYVPSYVMEDCLVDPRDLPPMERIKSEMQAFLEVMDYHKELRRKKGLPVAHA
jgi:benzoyl-CoA reductase/2-hydroxyglutaryl-CoA dehydratase subunit BcrC/BadD/HgdB